MPISQPIQYTRRQNGTMRGWGNGYVVNTVSAQAEGWSSGAQNSYKFQVDLFGGLPEMSHLQNVINDFPRASWQVR